jgi:hypothetical protein
VLFFALGTDGTQTWYQGLGANNGGTYGGVLLQPHGTNFGDAFDPTKIDKSEGLQFQATLGCSTGAATLGPAVVNGQAMFGPISAYALQRLTTPAGVTACSP